MTKLRFQVEKLAPYDVTETIYEPVLGKDGKHLNFNKIERVRTITDGYMVYFPAGHSITIEGRARLVEMNLINPHVRFADDVQVHVGDDRIRPPAPNQMAQEPTPKEINERLLAKHKKPNGVRFDATENAELFPHEN